MAFAGGAMYLPEMPNASKHVSVTIMKLLVLTAFTTRSNLFGPFGQTRFKVALPEPLKQSESLFAVDDKIDLIDRCELAELLRHVIVCTVIPRAESTFTRISWTRTGRPQTRLGSSFVF
jgi:hypothetical protein